MAYDQATFEGMRTQVLIVWTEMNSTWRQEDFGKYYSTWWGPDQTYDNSLAAEQDYFRSLIDRLDETIKEKELIKNENKTILTPYNQWYQQTLESFRNESKREGGLDWAIRPCFMMTFYSAYYWSSWWLIPLTIVLAIAVVVFLIKGVD
jgi:hypothetical protein